MRDVRAVVTRAWCGLRWDAAASGDPSPDETCAAYGEVVWSWRRDPGVYPLRLCGDGNGDNKGRSPGRARISRQTIARGKPGCPGCTRSNYPACSARGRSTGASSARLSLRPLEDGGTTKWQNPDKIRSRECLSTCAVRIRPRRASSPRTAKQKRRGNNPAVRNSIGDG